MLRGGEEEASYGFDMKELIGTTNAKSVAASLPGRVRSELLKDQRIDSVEVDVLTVQDGPGLTLEITVRAETGVGPFSLQLLASAVTVELLGIATV